MCCRYTSDMSITIGKVRSCCKALMYCVLLLRKVDNNRLLRYTILYSGCVILLVYTTRALERNSKVLRNS